MDYCEHAALKCSLKWFGPPCVEQQRDWLEAREQTSKRRLNSKRRSGLAAASIPLGSCWDWPVWRRFGRRRCLTRRFTSCGLSLRTILILLIVAVPFFPSCVTVDVCVSVNQEARSLFCRAAAELTLLLWMETHGRPVAADQMVLMQKLKKHFQAPGFCRDCLERFFFRINEEMIK